MVYINIPILNKKMSLISDGSDTLTLDDLEASDVEVIVSGIYLTETEDYSISNGKITFENIPLAGENINIRYKI